jgi:2,4-dienoyl-CoA reductase-like NADH-dependent reductase (Old Yellow Enzyme family)
VDAIEVSGGQREAKRVMSRPKVLEVEQEAYFADTARAVKAAVNVPVILVGVLRSLSVRWDCGAVGRTIPGLKAKSLNRHDTKSAMGRR